VKSGPGMAAKLVLLVALLVCNGVALRLTDKLSKDAGEILAEAQTNRTIRQCSCDEQHECFDESRHQLYECFEECWSVVKQVTNNTEGLKKCLTVRIPIIDNFFSCLEMNLHSCSASKTAANITYIDYNKVINSAEQRIHKQTMKLTRSVGTNASKLIQTALELGTCAKKCYLKKNSKGYCFDTKNCQPKIEVGSAVKSLKKCAGTVKWKETAGEACECAVAAGVNSLQQYCNMLKTIERTRNTRKPETTST